MTREELLSSYIPLADFIAKMNGGHCEVLIHDVRDLEHSIIYVTCLLYTSPSPRD